MTTVYNLCRALPRDGYLPWWHVLHAMVTYRSDKYRRFPLPYREMVHYRGDLYRNIQSPVPVQTMPNVTTMIQYHRGVMYRSVLLQ